MKTPLQHTRTASLPTRNPKSIRIRKFSLSLHRTSLAPTQTVEFVSPVPHLLTSNAPPSDSERILIQYTIDNVSNELSAAASKANHVPKVDVVAQKHLEAGMEFIQTHRAVLSPMRLLPPEILADIICIYAESFLLEAHPSIVTVASRGIVYPWVPSQVSRLWRSTALSLHHLWGQLVVDTCLWESNKPSKSFLGHFATLVNRSHEAPLCVYFCTPRNANVEDLRPIIEVLASHSERWETVYLISRCSVLNAFQNVKGRLPSLKRLFLSFSGEIPTTNVPVDMFEAAPQLKTLYLRTSYFSSEVLVPWSQLVVFYDGGDLSSSFPTDKTNFISESLVDLQLAGFPIDDLQKPWPSNTLNHLHSLNINLCNVDDDDPHDTITDNFFQSLTLPSVKEIRLTNYPGNIIPPLTSLINRSQQCTSLQDLSFSTYYLGEFEPGELGSLLQLTPFLKRLSIYLPYVLDLSRLIIQPGTPALLPNLEQLYIYVYDSFTGYEEILSQFTNSRCENSDINSDNLSVSSDSSSTSEKPPRLQHMRLIFPGAVLCHTSQELLETYNAKGSESEELSLVALGRVSSLKNWTIIANCLPSVFAYFWSSTPKLGVKIKRALQVSQFFSLIESTRVNDVRELYMSDIHHLMNHIHNIPSSDIPGDNIYHFRKRAKNLLDKWAPLLKNDIKNRRWAFQGAHSIVYVPTDSGIRTSPDVLTNMIYGARFYPQKYSVSWYDLQVMLQFLD